jgi:hypothetical protein
VTASSARTLCHAARASTERRQQRLAASLCGCRCAALRAPRDERWLGTRSVGRAQMTTMTLGRLWLPPSDPGRPFLVWAPAFGQWGPRQSRAGWLPLSSPVCPCLAQTQNLQRNKEPTATERDLNSTLTRTQTHLQLSSATLIAAPNLSLAPDLPPSQIIADRSERTLAARLRSTAPTSTTTTAAARRPPSSTQ